MKILRVFECVVFPHLSLLSSFFLYSNNLYHPFYDSIWLSNTLGYCVLCSSLPWTRLWALFRLYIYIVILCLHLQTQQYPESRYALVQTDAQVKETQWMIKISPHSLPVLNWGVSQVSNVILFSSFSSPFWQH